MKFKILTAFLITCNFALLQNKEEKVANRYSLKLGVGHHKVGLPFRKLFAPPFHIYSTVGIERKWKSVKNHFTYQTIDLGHFRNLSSGNGYFILSNFGIGYNPKKSFFLSGEMGLGFVHLFRPKAVYQLNKGGEYEQISDWGKVHFAIDFNLKVGYQFQKVGFFTEYKMMSEFMYNDDAVIYPQTFFSIGANYKI